MMSDLADLIRQCQSGDLPAFGRLFRLQEERVYALCLAILRNEQDAEDALQDVFLRLFARIAGFRGQASFETWLTRLVVNLCRDRLRRRKVRAVLSLEWLSARATAWPASDQAERTARRELWQLVDRLEERYRLPVILHYYQNMPCDQVAQVLGLRTSTVYSRLSQARALLRAWHRQQEESSGAVEAGLVG